MTTEHQEETPVQNLGEQLKQARESCKISQEEAAKRLRLRLCVIKALEENDYDIGIPSTYIQGYLKNYARLVSMPLENVRPTIELLKAKEAEAAEHKKAPLKPGDLASSNLTFRPIAYVVALVVIGILVTLWQVNSSENVTPPLAKRELLNPPPENQSLLPLPRESNATASAPLSPTTEIH